MKLNVFGMRKFSVILVLMVLGQSSLYAQNNNESAYRIRKFQFPEKALGFIETKLENARQFRFYKELDSSKITYEAKFKKERLRYGISFDEDGNFEEVKIRIKEVDIPEDSFAKITATLQKQFKKYRIRRMKQQYLLEDNDTEQTLKNAFQNIILPGINYELIISGKKANKNKKYEVLFDAAGNLLSLRNALPQNIDHVLY